MNHSAPAPVRRHLRCRCLLAALFTVISMPALQAAPPPIIIGVLNDQSGNYADLGGKGSVVAAEMAVEDFGGMVLGRPVTVISADHQDKADIASAIASKWFDEQGVDMITDMTFSSAALSVQHIAQLRGKVTIDTGAATSALIGEACSPTGFMWAFNTYTEAVATTSAILHQGGDSWALIVADYAFGQQLAVDIKTVLARSNGRLLSEQRYAFGASDFSSPLLTAQASGAKIVGLATGGTDLVNAVKQAAEFGLANKQTIAIYGASVFDVEAIGLDKAKGLFNAESFYWDRTDASRAFSKRYEARFGRVPAQVQAAVYSGVLHYLKSIAAAGTDDGVTVANKMRQAARRWLAAARYLPVPGQDAAGIQKQMGCLQAPGDDPGGGVGESSGGEQVPVGQDGGLIKAGPPA